MREPPAADAIAGFSLTAANLSSLADFYERALGFRRGPTRRLEGPEFEQRMQVQGGAHSLRLSLGAQWIELLRFDRPGRPYPARLPANDLRFQHFAVRVQDMRRAYRLLCAQRGWTPISEGGPQRLPPTSGGVTAFKFRDPEGHPLELLAGASLPRSVGVDHSAIVVRDTQRSVRFYRALGLTVRARSLNRGAGQAHLDALRTPLVEVTALWAAQDGPHLELLCYRSPARATMAPVCGNDVAATRTLLHLHVPFTGAHESARLLQDPDGHRLLLRAAP